MEINYVRLRGKKYETVIQDEKVTLDLSNKNINEISMIQGLSDLGNLQRLNLNYNNIKEIKGLEDLINLQELWLEANQITEINGLENLVNLEILSLHYNSIQEIKNLDNLEKLNGLYLNGNQITELKGIENLKKLKNFWMKDNPVSKWIKNRFGTVFLTKIKPILEYCNDEEERLKERNQKIRTERERLNDEKEITEKITRLMKVSTRVRLDMMREVLKMDQSEFFEKIITWAEQFDFTIDGDYIVIENADVDGFIADLDNQFKLWSDQEKSGLNKKM